MSLSCAYHALGATKIVEEEEYKKLFATGDWFDSPRTAWEHKYLRMPEYSDWPVIEGAHFLAGENPDSPPPRDTEKYQSIIKAIENDFIHEKLKFKERVNFKGDKVYFVAKEEFINWAIKRGFDIPKCCNGYKMSEQNVRLSTPSELGKKGSSVSNERHDKAKQMALRIAKDAWKNDTGKTKEDVAALVLAKFQEDKIANVDEPYSSSTVCKWIKSVMPASKEKGGRPKKAKTTS